MRSNTETIKILAIPGSLRKRSYNRSLVNAASELAHDGVSISVFRSLDEVPLFNEDVANDQTPAGVVKLRRALIEANGLLIATPEYNQAVPGVVKNMIDWLSIGEPDEGLQGRQVAVMGVTTGPWGTRLAQTMLRQMLVSTQAVLLPDPTLFLGDAKSLFDQSGLLVDQTTRLRVDELVAAFASWIRKQEPSGVDLAPDRSDNSPREMAMS